MARVTFRSGLARDGFGLADLRDGPTDPARRSDRRNTCCSCRNTAVTMLGGVGTGVELVGKSIRVLGRGPRFVATARDVCVRRGLYQGNPSTRRRGGGGCRDGISPYRGLVSLPRSDRQNRPTRTAHGRNKVVSNESSRLTPGGITMELPVRRDNGILRSDAEERRRTHRWPR